MAVLGCAGADLTRDGFVRSEIEAGGAVRSFVSFESSISLFRWRLSAPAQQQAAIAGWGHGRCRVSQGDGTSDQIGMMDGRTDLRLCGRLEDRRQNKLAGGRSWAWPR